jgi:hypothetical protein
MEIVSSNENEPDPELTMLFPKGLGNYRQLTISLELV